MNIWDELDEPGAEFEESFDALFDSLDDCKDPVTEPSSPGLELLEVPPAILELSEVDEDPDVVEGFDTPLLWSGLDEAEPPAFEELIFSVPELFPISETPEELEVLDVSLEEPGVPDVLEAPLLLSLLESEPFELEPSQFEVSVLDVPELFVFDVPEVSVLDS